MKQVNVDGELRVKWVECITDVLRYFTEVCEQNGLRYFIAYGSAIGAIRHKAIIPWDDDIDVVMPRPDYERFVHICNTTDTGKYELVTPHNTENYYLPFAKLCNKETTLLESDDFRCILGMYIDIFVYEGITSDKAESDRLRRRYVKYWNRFVVASSFYPREKVMAKLRRGEVKDLIHYYLLSLNRNYFRRRFLKKVEEVERAYDFDQTDKIVKYPPGYGEREVIPKEWILKSVLVPYEDLQVRVPEDYHRWLSNYFGDYMKFPPEAERHPHHLIAYVNLDARESLDVVLKKIGVK